VLNNVNTGKSRVFDVLSGREKLKKLVSLKKRKSSIMERHMQVQYVRMKVSETFRLEHLKTKETKVKQVNNIHSWRVSPSH